jgi:hypothetical protein
VRDLLKKDTERDDVRVTTTRPATPPPSMKPFGIALGVLVLILVATIVAVGVGGRVGSGGPSAGPGSLRTAYTAQELDRQVASEISRKCSGFTDALSVCDGLRDAEELYGGGTPGAGSAEVHCRTGVSTESPTTTCRVYSSRGYPVGPVTVRLIVTSGAGPRAGDERTMSILQIT